jgi:hypothetical protein
MIRAIAAVLLIGLAACEAVEPGVASPMADRPTATPLVQVIEHYPNFAEVKRDELFRLADIVALVRVTAQTDKAIGFDYVWRESQVELIKSYKGPSFKAIQQAGGKIPGREDVFHDLTYLEVGREYLVFLDVGTIEGTPSIQFFGDPSQLAFVPEADQYVSLGGGYTFRELELTNLAREILP